MFTKVAILLSVIVLTSAQLSFRTDANSNMYSIQTPSFQSTFTRYFGQPSGAIEAAEARPQAQFAPAPAAYNQAAGYNYAAPQTQQFDPAQAATNQQQQAAAYQQQPVAYQQPAAQYQQPAAQYQQPGQQQFSPQDIAAYFQQQQEASSQKQLQQHQFAPQQQQLDYAQEHQQLLAQQQAGVQQPSRYSQAQTEQAQQVAPVRIQFSPSNEVSSVKFSSGALKYNF